MELRQLEYFVAVAAERNFTRAAAKLHVTQPGVSAQIRQLERELGQALLDRSGRAVRLTEAGAVVLPFARSALGAVSGARLAVDEIAGLIRGRVAVGMVVQCATLDIPDLLAGFHRRHPGIELTLAEDNSDQLTAGVRDGTYDLAFIGLGPVLDQYPSGLGLQVVADEPIVAAVAADRAGPDGAGPDGAGPDGAGPDGAGPDGAGPDGAGPDGAAPDGATPDRDLAGVGSVTLGQIADQTVISLPAGTGLRACVDAAYDSAGLRARVGFEASDPRMLARLAARGLGLAFVPASVARAYGDGLHVITVSEPQMRGRLALTWRAQAPVSPAARALIEHARAALPEVAAGPAGR